MHPYTTFVPKTSSDVTWSADTHGRTLREAVHEALNELLPLFMDRDTFDTYTLGEDLAAMFVATFEDTNIADYRMDSDYITRKWEEAE
ncbi:hypothetical protein CKJ83_10575 [Corynebacterium hadale]|nr:hypothetical protein CKJ83_10575 [Corynebacterium hadale]